MAETTEPTAEVTEPEAMIAALEALIKMSQSEGWAILMVRLKAEAMEAKDEFVDVDPNNPREVAAAQDKIKRLEWFLSSVEELIQQGLDYDYSEVTEDEEFDDG